MTYILVLDENIDMLRLIIMRLRGRWSRKSDEHIQVNKSWMGVNEEDHPLLLFSFLKTFKGFRSHTLHTKTRELKFEPLSWQSLGEYVRKLIIRRYEVKFNHAFLNLLSNEMVSYVNVLGPGVLDIVAAESDGIAVIAIQGNLIEGKIVVCKL
ncbi:hypothetical protein Tco_0217040 [Tanacetum coccineum]